MASQKPVRVPWELQTPASRAVTWDLFSDTDRLNRAAELGYRYVDTPQPDGTLKRVGSITRLGITVTWDELPFHYAKPDWFRSVRVFHSGPAERLVTTARFRDLAGGGTGIRYSVEVTPRSALFRPLVAIELNTGTKKILDRTFGQVLALLEGSDATYDPTPPPLEPQAQNRLAEFCNAIEPQELGQHLFALIAHAPLQDQQRIRPLGLAREWGLPSPAVVDAFLTAAREGVLTVRWDVMCPSCRGPQETLPKLSFRGERIHCYACNIAFDATFADALEVSFRPSPQVRTFQLPVACAGSPGRQRHVVAQSAVAPEGAETLALDLPPGPYRLATLAVSREDGQANERKELNPVLVDVREDATDSKALVNADSFGLMPSRVMLRAGPVELTVGSESRAALALKLELRWQPSDVLTAGGLLEHPGALELIPSDTLDPAFSAEVRQLGVVVVESAREHQETLDKAQIAVAGRPKETVQRGERKLLAIFSDPAELVEAALQIARVADAQVAMGWGSVVVATDGEQTAAWGSAVRHAQAVLPAASPHTIVLYEAAAQATPLREALEARSLLVVRAPTPLPGGRPIYRVREY